MEKAIILGVAVVVFSTQLLGQRTSVVNDHEHYKVNIPKGWTVWPINSQGVLSATTYKPREALEGGIVPAGHAALNIFALRGQSRSLESWIDESVKDMEQVSRKRIRISNDPSSVGGVDSYVEVESRDDTGPGVYYRHVADYFSVDDRSFVIQLEFKEGDPLDSSYRSVLHGAVRTFSLIR